MENLNLLSKKKFTTDKYLTQVKISVNAEIERVLSVSSSSSIGSKQCTGGLISIGGKLFVNVMFVSTNGEILNQNETQEFIEKQSVNFELHDVFAFDKTLIKSVNFSGSEIIIVIEHETEILGFYNYEIATNFDDDKNLITNKKEISNLKLVKSCEDNFVVAEEAESNVSEMIVLGSNAEILAIETIAGVDKITVDAKISSEVVYKDADSIGTLCKEFEFKQEISADGVVPGMIVDSNLAISSSNITAEKKDERTNLIYAFEVNAQVCAYEENVYEIVTDIFSLNNQLQTTLDLIETKNFASVKLYEQNVLSQTNVADIENFDDVVGVFDPKFKIVSIEDIGETAKINGEISATMLYRANEKIEKINILSATVFEIEKDKNLVIENIKNISSIISYKVKAGKDLDASVKIELQVEYCQVKSLTVLKSFEIKQERKFRDGGIKVFVAGNGDTVFDVAKAVGVRPELIKEQNQVDEIFEEGQKIYIYSPTNLI